MALIILCYICIFMQGNTKQGYLYSTLHKQWKFIQGALRTRKYNNYENNCNNKCKELKMLNDLAISWFSYYFDMTTETKVWLQNHTIWFVFCCCCCCLTPEVKVCIHLENLSLFPNAMTCFGASSCWFHQCIVKCSQ